MSINPTINVNRHEQEHKQAVTGYPIQDHLAHRWRPRAFANRPNAGDWYPVILQRLPWLQERVMQGQSSP